LDASAQFAVATAPDVPAGSYAFTIIATAAGVTHQVAATLDVGGTPPPDPHLSALQGGGCSSPGPAMAGSLAMLAFLLWRARRRGLGAAAAKR
jgi:hypothetical protein